MPIRRKVSREAFEKFPGERWNAFNDLCAMSAIDQLTPVQRVAFLPWWYDSEVQNGGHFQYFVNRREFNQPEVLEALREIGALAQREILVRALSVCPQVPSPATAQEYVEAEQESRLEALDMEYHRCTPQIMDLLEDFLERHEAEFIEWVP